MISRVELLVSSQSVNVVSVLNVRFPSWLFFLNKTTGTTSTSGKISLNLNSASVLTFVKKKIGGETC